MQLSNNITLTPYAHGKLEISAYVREFISENSFDCIAIDLPSFLEGDFLEAIEQLPIITAITAKDESDDIFYIPIDPCDATVEATRTALSNHTPVKLIGDNILSNPIPLPTLPDEFIIKKIGYDAYSSLVINLISKNSNNIEEDSKVLTSIKNIKTLEKQYKNILLLVHFRDILFFVENYKNSNLTENNSIPYYQIETYPINPDHLYFALGELPFTTGEIEKERYDPLATKVTRADTIKNLFRDTRDSYYRQNNENALHLSPVRIQNAIKFLRNLTLQKDRFIPDLFDIVTSAKGVGGNSYALKILENSKYYPYLPYELSNNFLAIGIEQVKLPTGETVNGINLFRDENLIWKNLSIKPDPNKLDKKKYRFNWNHNSSCSHIPEDIKIENFNKHVRTKALKILSEEYLKSDKFETSVKDGIDIRETLRNWHTGDIYVKEIPPSKGKLDTIVVIFDETHDEKYIEKTVWFAEHSEESTLSFYATDPFSDMIGPGIARCQYGGFSLLFPPREIPSTFEIAESLNIKKLSHQLAYGAMLFSNEKSIAYISAKKPDIKLKQLASKLKKRILWIPLSSFSSEILIRLKRFHILNGHEIRSWATRFIGE